MIEYPLLDVVGDQSSVVAVEEGDLRDDLICGGGPLEGRAVLVPVGDVGADSLNEVGEGLEGAASDCLAGDDSEPGLDLVDPRTALGREVEVHIGVAA